MQRLPLFTSSDSRILCGPVDGRGAYPRAELRREGGAAVLVLRNEGGGGNWLQVELVGRAGNRDAIGARIYLEAGGSRQLRQIKAGSGFLSTSQRAPIFGLGTAQQVEKLEVIWPSGARQIHRDIAANQRLQIAQKAP